MQKGDRNEDKERGNKAMMDVETVPSQASRALVGLPVYFASFLVSFDDGWVIEVIVEWATELQAEQSARREPGYGVG